MFMKLKIKNFRSIDEKDIELPETGLVRIAGDSGTGKSTVVESLVWGLYGDALVKGIKPLTGSKKPVVTIESNGQVITRQNSPNRLLVESNGYENEAAQAFIDSTLNMNAEVFQSCSYIKQKLKGSLLSYTAADQLRFVQKIAFGNEDPEAHKLKITALIKEIENKIEVGTGQVSLLAEMVKSAQSDLEQAKQRMDAAPRPRYTSDERAAILKAAKELTAEYKNANDIYQNKRNELSKATNSLELLSSSENSIIAELEQQRTALEVANKELESLGVPDSRYTPEKIKAANELIRAQTIWLTKSEHSAKKLQKIQEIAEKHGDIKTIQKTIDELSTKFFEQKRKIESLNHEIYKAELSAEGMPCPHCSQLVSISNNYLIKSNDYNGHSPSELNKERETAKNLRDKLDDERVSLMHLQKELKSLIEETSDLNEAPLPAAQTHEQLRQFEEKIKNISSSVTSYNIKLPIIQDKIKESTARIATLEQDLIIKTQKKEETKAKIEILTHECTELLYLGQRLDADLGEMAESIKSAEMDDIYEIHLKQSEQDVERYSKKAKEAQDKYDDMLQQQTSNEFKLKNVLKLKELSDTAATQSIADILNAINQHAKVYTELLFPNQGTVITLNNVRLNKDDSVRAKMSVSVFHKGMEYDSLDQLSGGEQNRAMLAFQLALSDLFNSPILLLDEAFAGAHTELKNDCIESLRSVSSRKLVIIVEHGLDDGLFDEVIYV
jgi:DNA repair exonuclease SbcCD ATPase subunit